MKKALIIAALGGAIGLAAFAGSAFFQTSDLDRIHAGIEASHENVAHISAGDFAEMPTDGIVLFDVREPEEFAVSHLPGAILVDPDISAAAFESEFAQLLEGKTAIFYCSVGVRSSILAERVSDYVQDETQTAPFNLIGGLFQWSNDNRSMVSVSGEQTDAIHPYDAYWGRLIESREAIRYEPVS